MKWATSDDLGVIAFATRKDAATAFLSHRQVRCVFAMGFRGWLAVDPYGSDNAGTIKTPDGREIPVVSGYTSEHGRLIGMRGGTPRAQFAEHWRVIMARVIDATLELHAHRQPYQSP